MESEATATEETTAPRGFRHRGESGGASAITLGPRDTLIGKLTVDGDVRIQGTLEGELSATGDVSVENQGTLKAPVEARNVNVRGQLEGDVTAREKLIVAGSGTVTGNVRVARLAIEDGATLNGTVQMVSGGGRASGGAGEGSPEPS